MKRPLALAACAALITSPLAMASSDPGGPGDATALGRIGKRVLVVGDSLAVGTRPYLNSDLGDWRVRHSISISKHAPEGAAELARRHRRLPPVVVASLGTNDDPGAIGSFDHSVRTALHAAGKRGCVVWPNIVRPPVGGRTYAGYNAVLARLASRRENLIVVDWTRIAAGHREWFGDDGVHPNGTGYAVRAAAIARAVRRCRARLGDEK